jgi:L-amino acid N-acyltransferase YncA
VTRDRSERLLEPGLRDARDSDWPFVERLYVEAMVEGQAYGAAEAAAHVHERRARWKLTGAYAIVATDAERHLGVIWVLEDLFAAGCDYVQLIATDRPHRRRRVAETLLRAAIERSTQRGRERLRAGIHPRNRPSLRLFETFGFRPEDQIGDLVIVGLRLGT